MSESFTSASTEFFRDAVKAAIEEIPDYRTPMSGRWRGSAWVAQPLPGNDSPEVRDITMTIRTRSGMKVIAQGPVSMVDGEWSKARLTIQVPSKDNHSCWRIEGQLNSEGDFEYSTPRRLV